MAGLHEKMDAVVSGRFHGAIAGAKTPVANSGHGPSERFVHCVGRARIVLLLLLFGGKPQNSGPRLS